MKIRILALLLLLQGCSHFSNMSPKGALSCQQTQQNCTGMCREDHPQGDPLIRQCLMRCQDELTMCTVKPKHNTY
ncbi:hypothetical protein JL49_24050 [Pseudoalteromonas luteoviolacea]|nr:hypothetical protein JL49_24050 [Pseudoalteromonas luteoviolacea]